jgi:hypothetical protein
MARKSKPLDLNQQFDDEERIYEAVKGGALSLRAVIRQTGIPRDRVERALVYLCDIGAFDTKTAHHFVN